MTSLRIGILTEDATDGATVEALIRRLLGENGQQVGIKRRGSGGCAHLLRKAETWMAELADQGCTSLVFVHDLDRNPANGTLNDETQLRQKMERIPIPAQVSRHICIPIEELEAWFWSDPDVLERIAPDQGRARAHSSPHLIRKPKEALMRLSASVRQGKGRYTPQLNRELAQTLDLELCAKRCPSFKDLRSFIWKLAGAASSGTTPIRA